MTDIELIVACNAGSSSLKIEAFSGPPWTSRIRMAVEGIGAADAALRVDGDEPSRVGRISDYSAAADLLLDQLADRCRVDAAGVATGHRLVHGGAEFSAPVRVTAAVLQKLETVAALAPLHNPPALAVMEAVEARFPGRPRVAVFDTAFFHDLPAVAQTYALPLRWRASYGLRRYGFHGIAHAYLYRSYVGNGGRGSRVMTLQLGQGCSSAALREGKPVETSMGYTPLEGLIMGTRGGDVDPGLLLELLRQGETLPAVEHALNHESGLQGLAGSADMRELLTREAAGDAAATLAIAAFCHRIRKYIGAYAAVLGGLDAVLIGGGIGEHSPEVRARLCRGFEWLGLELDEHGNTRCDGQAAIVSTPGSRVAVHVIPVREEQAIARLVCKTLGMDGAGFEAQ